MGHKNYNFLDKNQKNDKEVFLKNNFLYSCQKLNQNFTPNFLKHKVLFSSSGFYTAVRFMFYKLSVMIHVCS